MLTSWFAASPPLLPPASPLQRLPLAVRPLPPHKLRLHWKTALRRLKKNNSTAPSFGWPHIKSAAAAGTLPPNLRLLPANETAGDSRLSFKLLTSARLLVVTGHSAVFGPLALVATASPPALLDLADRPGAHGVRHLRPAHRRCPPSSASFSAGPSTGCSGAAQQPPHAREGVRVRHAGGRLPWIMNIAAASYKGAQTIARMQSRDEPTIVHFVSGEGKPWLYMVLRFQKMEGQIPPAVQGLAHAWEQLYWLAKSNRVCSGALLPEELQTARLMLEGF